MHSYEDRGADAYFSPREAVLPFLSLEEGYIPQTVWEPACGDGAIAKPLAETGRKVFISDLYDYGLEDAWHGVDYLTEPLPEGCEGVVTNPPFRLAAEFAKKAIAETNYVALLLRLQFLEGVKRQDFLQKHLSRVYVSSRRLPMMHRRGWKGPLSTSNQAFAWFIFQRYNPTPTELGWFDWKDYV